MLLHMSEKTSVLLQRYFIFLDCVLFFFSILKYKELSTSTVTFIRCRRRQTKVLVDAAGGGEGWGWPSEVIRPNGTC